MKKRFIACVVACAMLLMGTGYAYWTDLFTISGTVDTGNFNVKLVDANYDGILTGAITDYKEYPGDLNNLYSLAEGKITSPKINGSADSVTLALDNIYPGYGYKFKFTADNLGTVAAQLSSIRFDKSMPDDLANAIGISLIVEINDVAYIWIPVLGFISTIVDISEDSYDFTIRGVDFVSLSEVPSTIAVDANKLFLDTKGDVNTKHDMVIKLAIGMNPDAKGDYTTGTWLNGELTNKADHLTESKEGTLTLQFLWDQYNAKPKKN